MTTVEEKISRFTKNGNMERGLRSVNGTQLVSVYTQPIFTRQPCNNVSSQALNQASQSNPFQFIIPSNGYFLTWDGLEPRFTFTLTNTTNTPCMVEPLFMIQRADQYYSGQQFTGRFNEPWVHTLDKVFECPRDILQVEGVSMGLPISDFSARPFYPARETTVTDIIPQFDAPSQVLLGEGTSSDLSSVIAGQASAVFSYPLSWFMDGVQNDHDGYPLPLEYMTCKFDIIIRPINLWAWQIPALDTAPVVPSLTISEMSIEYYRCAIEGDLNLKMAALVSQGALSRDTIISATMSLPVTYSANSSTSANYTSLPKSARFYSQYFDCLDVQALPTTAHKNLERVDFGLRAYQHIADGQTLEQFQIECGSGSQTKLTGFQFSDNTGYLKKRTLKEYSKVGSNLISPIIYQGYGTGAPAAYPTCYIAGLAANSTISRISHNRLFRIAGVLQSANSDVYSGFDVSTSFITQLFFGPQGSQSRVNTSSVTATAPTLISNANLTTVFYCNAQVLFGTSRSAILV